MQYRNIAAAIIAGATIATTPTLAHADTTVERTVTWLIPAGVSEALASQSDQTLLPDGVVPCGRTGQRDTYRGTDEQIDAVLADGKLNGAVNGVSPVEDHLIYVRSEFVYGGKCAPVKAAPKPVAPAVKTYSRYVQVDRYLNPTSKLRKAAAAYDNDGKLAFREDRAHYGHSTWWKGTVTIKATKAPTAAQWITAINKATPARVGDVTTTAKATTAGPVLVVAWDATNGWRDSRGGAPQLFIARS